MKLELINYECGVCRGQFKAPAIVSHTYGEFLLRSVNAGNLAYLYALTDKAYDDVEKLIQTNSRTMLENPQRRAKILQAIYGAVACDPDKNGNIFQIGLHPSCPACKSQIMQSWQVTEPIEFIDIAIPAVTHFDWNSLSEVEKVRRVNNHLSLLSSPNG